MILRTNINRLDFVLKKDCIVYEAETKILYVI
jgi:hypothetical protein